MLLGLILSIGLHASAKMPFTSETDKELIEKARQLLLQKERVSAISLLSTAAQRETKRGNQAGARALVGALEEISTTFLLDRAQQSYELGLSLVETEPSQALGKFEDAARLETKNFAIELAIVRMNIILGTCSDAVSKARTLLALNRYSGDTHLVLAQALSCANDLQELRKVLSEFSVTQGDNLIYWDLLKAQELFHGPAIPDAHEKLKQVMKADEGFPEVHYWMWKIEDKLKGDAAPFARKYLSLCKNPIKGIYRKYMKEPLTCRRMPEVEAFLKKMEL